MKSLAKIKSLGMIFTFKNFIGRRKCWR